MIPTKPQSMFRISPVNVSAYLEKAKEQKQTTKDTKTIQYKDRVFKELAGRKLMLCDVIYQSPTKETGWKDYINFVYKDLYTGKKGLYTIETPSITIYEVKEEYRTFRKARHYIELEKCIPHTVPYKNVLLEIAKIAGPDYIKYYKTHKLKSERRQLFKYPYVLGGDIPIETVYRVIWEQELGNDEKKEVDCCYLDIEVNQHNWDGPIPRKGECPIDMVSLADEKTNKVYTFYLKMKDNDQIVPFINDRQEELQKKLHDRFDEAFPGCEYIQYAFEEDQESELLTQLFRLMNVLKRDICFIWNMDFDIPYIIHRAIKLKMNPANLFCHSDFPTTTLFYHEDERNFDWDKKRNYFDCSSYTHYLDQPAVYAGLRRSQKTLRKMSLDYIAREEEHLWDGKVNFSTTGGNFIMFSYNNFLLFDIYSCNDVQLQRGINEKCHDATNIYNSSLTSFCNYKDALKQTVSLRAFFYKEFLLDQDLILGHNVNFDNYQKNNYADGTSEDEINDTEIDNYKDSFEGAINGDTNLNGYNGLIIFGNPSKYLYGACIDFDFSGMYPNSICSFNIFATTMIGKLFIEDGDKLKTYDDDAGKEFVEDLISVNVTHMGTKWFGLPSFEQLDREVASALRSCKY